MFKYILPIILIGAAITGFFLFTNPLYKNISLQKMQAVSFNEALDNSKVLEAERDKLTFKFNSFDSENIYKLQKLLPDNVDNIRLILEIEKIALPYGMVLRDVKYNAVKENASSGEEMALASAGRKTLNKDYSAWDLEFTTQGTYQNFIYFLKDLERNLRIVDISSIQFSSSAGSQTILTPSLPESYKYSFKIKTYWLKN